MLQAGPYYEHIESAYMLLCAMATEQHGDQQQKEAVAAMISKQIYTLEQKVLLLVAHSITGSALLPDRVTELVRLMACTIPWTLRLILLRLICVLPDEQKCELLTDSQSAGLDCLQHWFLAASNIPAAPKREAVQLALLQTFAVLGHADHSLMEPWMLNAANKLVLSCPFSTVRLAAAKFRRLCELHLTEAGGVNCQSRQTSRQVA